MNSAMIEKMLNYLIEKHAFVLGYPIEATDIARVCDYVLTAFNGHTLSIIGMIDTSKHPLKRAVYTQEQLNTIRQDCRQFIYHAYGKRRAIEIEFWYVGEDAVKILEEDSIQDMKANGYQFSASCWALDTSSQKVVSNTYSFMHWLKQRNLTKMINQNRILSN
jgi:hypothetical protein